MSQFDIKPKTCDIRTSTKHSFLDISSTNPETVISATFQFKVNWDIFSTLKHALIRVGGDVPMILGVGDT
jgi:hypothetical protein